MDTFSSAPTSRMPNTQLVQDDCRFQIVSVVIYENEDSQAHQMVIFVYPPDLIELRLVNMF